MDAVAIFDLMNKGLNTEAGVQKPDDKGFKRFKQFELFKPFKSFKLLARRFF